MRPSRLILIAALVPLSCATVPQGQRRSQDTEPPGAVLVGEVLSPDGKPVEGAEVSTGYSRKAPVRTDRKGVFRLDGLGEELSDELGPGESWTQWFFVRHPDYVPVRFGPVELRCGQVVSGVAVRLVAGGRIGGTVTDEDGALLPNADVTIRTRTKRERQRALPEEGFRVIPFAADSMNAVTTETDEKGCYLSEPLLPGAYHVWANARDVVPSRAEPVEVAADETAQLDFVLAKGVSISGRVIDVNGNPVPTAEVIVDDRLYSDWTDDDGRFHVGGLRPGTHWVDVDTDDQLRNFLCFSQTYVAPADDVTIKLRPGGTVSGQVVDAETGERLRHFFVSISLQRRVPEIGYGLRLGGVSSVRTDDEGRFAEHGYHAGTYSLEIRREGYAPAIIRDIVVREGAEPEPLRVELHRGTTLELLVVSAEDGSPIARTWIGSDIGRSPGEMPDFGGMETDEDGRFIFEHVSAGRYDLGFQRYGFLDQELTVEIAPGEEIKRVTVKLTKRTEPDEDSGLCYGHVTGTVMSNEGKPKADVLIRRLHLYFDPDEDIATDEAGKYSLRYRSEGVHNIAAIATPGERSRTVIVKQVVVHGEKETRLDFVLDERISVRGTVTVRERPVEGAFLVAVPRGVPSPDWLDWMGTIAQALTDDKGQYQMHGLGPGEYWLLLGLEKVGGTGLVRRELELTGQALEVDVALQPGSICGKVTSSSGVPIVDAYVRLVPEVDFSDPLMAEMAVQAFLSAECLAKENGTFALPNVAPGSYELLVERVGYVPYRCPIEVQPNEQFDELAIRLEEEAVVMAHVRSDTGRTPSELLVVVSDSDDRVLSAYLYSVDTRTGLCRFEGLPTGKVTITAVADGYAVVHRSLHIPPDREQRVSVDMLDLAKGHDLTVAVLDDEGRPVPQPSIHIDSGGPPLLEALLNHAGDWGFGEINQPDEAPLEGKTTFHNTADGAYTVRVSAFGHRPAEATVHMAGHSEDMTVILKSATSDNQ